MLKPIGLTALKSLRVSKLIERLEFKVGFFGQGYTKIFYDVEAKDVELYESKEAYNDPAWYIRVRGSSYNLCPSPTTRLIERESKRANDLLANIKEQIESSPKVKELKKELE